MKAKKKLITQKEAAAELGMTERHVRRLLRQLKCRGDKVVAHALRGFPSNRKISADTEQEAVTILSQPVYRGFGPTLASEYLAKKHDIEVSRETVRQWMIAAKWWRARKRHVEKVHEWRPRRSRFGELVQWDTSDHDWLEGRGEEILLINMIDHVHGQEEVVFRVNPALMVRGESAGWNQAMDMRMELQVLSPGVQDADEPNLRAESLRLSRDFEHGRGTGSK